MKKIIKQFIGTVKAIDENERTITATVSTGTPDRVGESIPAKEWNLSNYAKNPVILWAHDYIAPPVGKALWSKVEGDGLIQKIKFASTAFATDIFNLYKDGFLNAFSVGFQAERAKDNPNRFEKAELLEVSCVPVPCNAEALAQRMLKGEVKFSPRVEIIVRGLIKAAKKDDKKPAEKIVDETETQIRVRVRNPDDFDKDSFRTIDIDKTAGISSVVGKLLDGGDSMVIQNYMFDKAKDWTVEKAVAWVEAHKEDAAPQPPEDDKDKQIADLVAQKAALLADLGVYKVGRVLSNKNRALIGACVDSMKATIKALTDLYDATDPDAEQESAPVPDHKHDESIDKSKKTIIIYDKKTPTGISAKDVPEIVAAGIKAADIPGAIRREINRLKGIIE